MRTTPPPEAADALLEAVDVARIRLPDDVSTDRRAELGQFLTPATVARELASMFMPLTGHVRVLDPGAGLGVLGAALVARLLSQPEPPTGITLVAYEIDPAMHAGLKQTLVDLEEVCSNAGVSFDGEFHGEDFLASGSAALTGDLLSVAAEPFDAAILNPPYRKISAKSAERAWARSIGLEASNAYAAFLGVAAGLLRSDGQLVAIVPRSFTNGSYFRPFRKWFAASMAYRRLHVYDARNRAFADDDVLQENVIFHAVKTKRNFADVTITASTDPSDSGPSIRTVPYAELIRPNDLDAVIHVVADETNYRIARRVGSLSSTLKDLGLTVSTGRVVDFRAKDHLRRKPDETTVPLIYPAHLRNGRVQWPVLNGKKANALHRNPSSEDLLVPEGIYVLTKRFTSKEEKRRVVASIYDPAILFPDTWALKTTSTISTSTVAASTAPWPLASEAILILVWSIYISASFPGIRRSTLAI